MSKIFKIEGDQKTLVLETIGWKNVIAFIKSREQALGVAHTKYFPEDVEKTHSIYCYIGDETYFAEHIETITDDESVEEVVEEVIEESEEIIDKA